MRTRVERRKPQSPRSNAFSWSRHRIATEDPLVDAQCATSLSKETRSPKNLPGTAHVCSSATTKWITLSRRPAIAQEAILQSTWVSNCAGQVGQPSWRRGWWDHASEIYPGNQTGDRKSEPPKDPTPTRPKTNIKTIIKTINTRRLALCHARQCSKALFNRNRTLPIVNLISWNPISDTGQQGGLSNLISLFFSKAIGIERWQYGLDALNTRMQNPIIIS